MRLMDRLKLIQCGVGGFGQHWVDLTCRSEDFEVAAIVDIAEPALSSAGDKYSIPANRRFTSLEAALASIDADAVLSVTPPAVHLEHARLAFSRGLHMMTEKPVAVDLQTAMEMTSLAKRAGRHLLVSQNYRFNAPMLKLRDVLRQQPVGSFGHGDIDFYIPADFTGTFREQMPYVLLVDMAIHHLDLIRSITGRNIVRVFARTFRPAWSWYAHHPGLKMVLELENGGFFSYSGDWSARGRDTNWNGNWRLQCEHGSIHYESSTGKDERIVVARSSRGFSHDVQEEALTWDTPAKLGQAATLQMFAQAIRTGQKCEISAEENLWSFGAVMAALKSEQEQCCVDVRELLGM